MATLAHVLQLVGWWVAPLIIFLLKRDSRFVSFHALQALLLQVASMTILAMGMVGWFAIALFSVVAQASAHSSSPPIGMFMAFPLFWLTGMGVWVAVLVAAIVYGIKAGNGEWAEYPVLGALARRILHLGRGGTPV